MSTSIARGATALAFILPLSLAGILSAPAARAQQGDEFSGWLQRCRSADPSSQLHRDCATAEAVCQLGKMINSPRSYAECVDKALKYDEWSEQRGSSSGENANERTCRHSTDYPSVIPACRASLASGRESTRERTEDLMHLAYALEQTGQREEAEANYTRAIELGPQIPPSDGTLAERNSFIGIAYEGRCSTLVGRSQWDAVARDCSQAITLRAGSPFLHDAYFLRGVAYATIAATQAKPELFDKALADFKDAVALDPNDARSLYEAGLVERFYGRFRKLPELVARGDADIARAKAIDPHVDAATN